MGFHIVFTQYPQTAVNNTSGNRVFSGICFLLHRAENREREAAVLWFSNQVPSAFGCRGKSSDCCSHVLPRAMLPLCNRLKSVYPRSRAFGFSSTEGNRPNERCWSQIILLQIKGPSLGNYCQLVTAGKQRAVHWYSHQWVDCSLVCSSTPTPTPYWWLYG